MGDIRVGVVQDILGAKRLVEDLFRYLIAIAAGGFQADIIQNRNLATVILNESGLLQLIRSHRDSRSTGAQHQGKSIVC